MLTNPLEALVLLNSLYMENDCLPDAEKCDNHHNYDYSYKNTNDNQSHFPKRTKNGNSSKLKRSTDCYFTPPTSYIQT